MLANHVCKLYWYLLTGSSQNKDSKLMGLLPPCRFKSKDIGEAQWILQTPLASIVYTRATFSQTLAPPLSVPPPPSLLPGLTLSPRMSTSPYSL